MCDCVDSKEYEALRQRLRETERQLELQREECRQAILAERDAERWYAERANGVLREAMTDARDAIDEGFRDTPRKILDRALAQPSESGGGERCPKCGGTGMQGSFDGPEPCTACGATGKAPDTTRATTGERMPYLKNRADGVDGHYVIARDRDGYSEFWTERGWSSAGTVFRLHDTAPAPADRPDGDMRRTLVTQVHELIDQIEQNLHLFGDDAEARAQAEGAIRYAMKAIEPYDYNGADRPEPTGEALAALLDGFDPHAVYNEQMRRVFSKERALYVVAGEAVKYALNRQHLQAGVPEAVRRLPDEWRTEPDDGGGDRLIRALNKAESDARVRCADELESALAAHDSESQPVPAVPDAVRQLPERWIKRADDKALSYSEDERRQLRVDAVELRHELDRAMIAATPHSETQHSDGGGQDDG